MFSFEHRCKWLSILVFIPFYATSLQSQEPSPEPDIAWVQNYSTVKFDGQDTPKDMLVDKSGNIYALANVVNLTNPPSIFLVKLDSSGQEQWRVQYKDGSGKRSKGVGLGLDAEQNIYVLGYITANDSLSEIITIKYDAFGNQLWSVQYQGEFGSTATALAVSSAGDLYIFLETQKLSTTTGTLPLLSTIQMANSNGHTLMIVNLDLMIRLLISALGMTTTYMLRVQVGQMMTPSGRLLPSV